MGSNPSLDNFFSDFRKGKRDQMLFIWIFQDLFRVFLSFLFGKQAGNGPRRRPAEGSKEYSFLNMQRTLLSKVSSNVQCRKYQKNTHQTRTQLFSNMKR